MEFVITYEGSGRCAAVVLPALAEEPLVEGDAVGVGTAGRAGHEIPVKHLREKKRGE